MCKQNQQLSLCSPKLLKMPAGLHTSRRRADSAVWLLSWALARRDLTGISHVLVRHTPDQGRSSRVVPGCGFLPSLLFICR